jgi:signal transduction histidine kinase/CheY-like chemotaxis protein
MLEKCDFVTSKNNSKKISKMPASAIMLFIGYIISLCLLTYVFTNAHIEEYLLSYVILFVIISILIINTVYLMFKCAKQKLSIILWPNFLVENILNNEFSIVLSNVGAPISYSKSLENYINTFDKDQGLMHKLSTSDLFTKENCIKIQNIFSTTEVLPITIDVTEKYKNKILYIKIRRIRNEKINKNLFYSLISNYTNYDNLILIEAIKPSQDHKHQTTSAVNLIERPSLSIKDNCVHYLNKNFIELFGTNLLNKNLNDVNQFAREFDLDCINIDYLSDTIMIFIQKSKVEHEIWQFLSNSSISCGIMDTNFKIKLVNNSMQKTFGLPSSYHNVYFIDLLKQDEVAKFENFIKHTVDKDILEPTEIHLIQNDKSAQVHITPIIYNMENHYIFTLIDTTKYKTLELNFVHSQKMQAVGQLSGAIAHDFNNLLTAMVGFCDLLLLRHPPGDKSFTELMQIKQNVNRAAGLVRQLLAFSRKQVMQPTVLEITNIVADLSNLMSRLIGENISLNIEHGRDLDLVKVDQGQLEQVIINLAVNSRDAMKDGGKLIVRTYNYTVDSSFDEALYNTPIGDENIEFGDYVVIEVTDTGTGIPQNLIGKIFEPFFSTKSLGSGTGLGLATVLGIIKQTHGYLRFKTQKNKGTSFYIFLPSVKGDEDDKIKETTNLFLEENIQSKISFDINSTLASTKDLTGAEKILIVEDEKPVRLFGKHALTNKGYEVLEAESPEEALKIIKEEGDKIDLIITDVMMPGMTGPKMIEIVKKQYPDIKVIFISGYAEDALDGLDTNNENFYFLPKPFNLKQLATMVKDVISGKANDLI